MRGADKDKKPKVAEERPSPSDAPEHLQSIGKLQEIQDELDKINVRASDEVLELEQKFNEQRKPVFARRNEVIESIQGFWLSAFLSHPTLSDILTKEDEQVLKHMVSLEVEEAKDVKSGYTIILNFSPNPYFEDEKLAKTYSFNEQGHLNIMCKPIKWKKGKGITNVSSHGKGPKRPYTSESFFTWFSEDVTNDGQVDEIAEIIREDLWLNPLRHLQNEVDAMGLYGEEEEVTGGGKEGVKEDEDEEEVVDDDDKEYHEEDGDDEMEEDDNEDGDADAD